MSSAFLELYPDDLTLGGFARTAVCACMLELACDKREILPIQKALAYAWTKASGQPVDESELESYLESCWEMMPDLDDWDADVVLYWLLEAACSTLTSWERESAVNNCAAECMAAFFESEFPDLPELEDLKRDLLPPQARELLDWHLQLFDYGARKGRSTCTRNEMFGL